MNDEMFRLSLIDFMNDGLLNDFVNNVFDYKLKSDQYIYIQYKIVNNNIVLNLYDNSDFNRFKAFIFTDEDVKDDNKNIYYINIEDCYLKYRNRKNENKICLLGALLKAENNNEKLNIIDCIESDNPNIKNILLKHFIV